MSAAKGLVDASQILRCAQDDKLIASHSPGFEHPRGDEKLQSLQSALGRALLR
jgi:hypothetical protein